MKRYSYLPFLIVLSACVGGQPAGPVHSTEASQSIAADDRLEQLRAELIEFRRDLHMHPELSGQEERTAARVADRLRQLGFEVRRNVGGHGVVALLRGNHPGRVVAFRADMDAVTSDALDPVEFRSQTSGVRHICGHDIHTTVGVAIGEAFAAMDGDFPGTLMLVFQPAEENLQGARAMLAEGALAAPKPDAIFAFHTAPYEVGQIGFSEATLMSSADRASVYVQGDRSVAEAMRDSMRAIGNSERNVIQPIGVDFVVAETSGVEAVDGGWRVNGFFTLATEAASQRVRSALDSAALRVRAGGRARVELTYQARFAPGVSNDTALTRRALASMREELGEGALRPITGISPAFTEDFGAMLDETPGAMFFLGVSNEARGWVGLPHSPNYVADEEAIFIGARAMTRVLRDYLSSGAAE